MFNQLKFHIVFFIGLLVLVKTASGTTFVSATKEFCQGINNSLKCAQSIERSRLAKHKGLVERKGNKLRLQLHGGHVVELKDLTDEECENSSMDDICHYAFWDFLRPTDYYLVFNQYWEGVGFSLVSRRTGQRFVIDEFPNLSPDNKRFVTVDINDAHTNNRIQIWKFTGSGISLEWTYNKHEGNEEYWAGADADWIDHWSIRITYHILDDKGDLVSKHLIARLNAQGWQILGENDSLK